MEDPNPFQIGVDVLRKAFVQKHVTHASPGSGKTTAIFQAADEFSKACSCRVAIVGPSKDQLMAEAVRIRLRNAVPYQFARLDFFGEDELEELKKTTSDVMVDEWFKLSEQARNYLTNNFRILAAVGTDPSGKRRHGELISI